MKCASCGYTLWNLREPRCPECGESFNVEDWTFESGTVRFHCNECDHPLMHRQPGYGPARCSNCNEIIAWSDVRVVPLGDPVAHKGDRLELTEGFPIGPAIFIFMVLTCWSSLLMPTPGGLAATEPVGFLLIAAVIGLYAAMVGILLSPRCYRWRAVFVWGGLWLVYVTIIWRLMF